MELVALVAVAEVGGAEVEAEADMTITRVPRPSSRLFTTTGTEMCLGENRNPHKH